MSRRRRNLIIVLLLCLGAVVIWLDHSTVKDFSPAGPNEADRTADLEKYHGKSFTVLKVVDGDTLDLDIPDGRNSYTRVRLWGLDTPETKNPRMGVCYFGPEAAEFTTKLTSGKSVRVYLDTPNHTRGKYGRLLAYIRLPDGRFLNEVLLSEGFAYADLRFTHSFYYKYSQLEASARSAGKGLWQKVTRRQLPEWLQRKRPKLLKKTGGR